MRLWQRHAKRYQQIIAFVSMGSNLTMSCPAAYKGNSRQRPTGTMSLRLMLVALLLSSHSVPSIQSEDFKMGAFECPCIEEGSEAFYKARTILKQHGKKETLGLQGCKEYNDNSADCNPYPNSCKRQWCYVNMEICKLNKLNKKLCEDAGGRIGSMKSKYCRGRPVTESMYVNDSLSLSYSYETCGALGSYNESRFEKWISGVQIQYTIDKRDHYPNSLLKELIDQAIEEYGFLEDERNKKANTLSIREKPRLNDSLPFGEGNWWTEQSASTFNDSYSKCVHDVAIGNTDLCVADIWITPNRAAMAHFLPPVRFDHFYLMAFSEERTTWELGSLLSRPFKPFYWDAWIGIIVCFALFAMVPLLAKCMKPMTGGTETAGQQRSTTGTEEPRSERDHNVRYHSEDSRLSVSSMASTFISTIVDLFVGDSGHFSESGNTMGKLAGCGFWFFMLVVSATYTANLASVLVAESENATLQGKSLADARDVSICVHRQALEHFNQTYRDQGLKWEPVDREQEIPEKMHAEVCSMSVMYQASIDMMKAGQYCSDADCQREACEINRVSDEVLLTFAVGFPVNRHLAHSLSWALTKAFSEGTAGVTEKKHTEQMQKISSLKCPPQRDPYQLKLVDIAGALFLSIGVLILAGFLYLLREKCPCWKGNSASPSLAGDDPAGLGGAAPAPEVGARRASSSGESEKESV